MERDVVANYDIMKETFIAVYSQNSITWSLGVPVLADFEESQLKLVYSFESRFPVVDLLDTRNSYINIFIFILRKYVSQVNAVSTSILEP